MVTEMPECAWPRKYGTTGTNAYWPDTVATYWSTIFPVSTDLTITISGVFPDSRYISFNVYDENPAEFTTNGVNSGLPDYKITPDPGSVNPWQQQGEPGGRFTVTVRPDATPGQTNTLPLAPEGTEEGTKGSVIFRVYLPTGGDSTVALPTVTLTRNGVSTTLPTCAADRSTPSAPSPTRTDTPTPTPTSTSTPYPAIEPEIFAHTSELENLAPNTDNAYLGAWITPPGPDNVVVIRGKAPRAITGTHPVAWPRRHKDVRYWSMCTNLGGSAKPVVVNKLPDGGASYGCRYNDETELDHAGYYTYVIGTEAQRAAVEAIDKVTFLPFSTAFPNAQHMILLRNLLPVDSFRYAIQNVPLDSEPAVAATVMGPYYPLVSICPLDSLTTRGSICCAHNHR